MQRDRRSIDNWALIYAQMIALEKKVPLLVLYSLNGDFPSSNLRQYGFMLKGLSETIENLHQKNIPCFIARGNAAESVVQFLTSEKAGFLVTDFSPLKVYKNRTSKVSKSLSIPVHIVDTHNIIPIGFTSDKQEYAAYTIRSKIHKKIDEFLTPIPRIVNHPFSSSKKPEMFRADELIETLNIDHSVAEVSWVKPGEASANETLQSFIKNRFDQSDVLRNDPNQNKLSNLSPFLHFGQISAQRIALTINQLEDSSMKDSFLEQLIVRRELSDNFCYYNNFYDSFDGFPKWAQTTLDEHRYDEREYVYNPLQFENAETHDNLWNAAQTQMVEKGKMHGFLRMYWAKKILEWSPSPESALQTAIDLNDKYELDGRDPNGYTGIAWSIGGVHDRPWFERAIFGKVRFMNYNGCKRKFNVAEFINKNNAHNAHKSV